jgi:hypothetical protein
MRAHAACTAALVALALAGYGFLLADPGSVITAHSDALVFHYKLKQALWDSLRAGRGLPLWQSQTLSGSPAVTNPQAQYLLPLHFLFWLLPPARAIAPTVWLTLLCAGLSTYALGAALGLGAWPRLLMGAAGLFSPKLILAAYAGWLAYLPTIALLPLLVAAVISALERPGPRAAALAAISGALCLLTGMTQLLYYALFFLAALFAARASRRGASTLALGAALALGLSAVQLLPFLAELRLYARGELSYPIFLSGHGAVRQLLTLVWPEALGTPLTDPQIELWEDSAHFGWAVLLLAVVGAARARLFAGLVAAALLLSFDSPLLRLLFAALPGMRLFRIPSRILFLAALFATCLAGFGLERLLQPLRPRVRAAVALAAVAAVAVQGASMARRYFAHPQPGALESQGEALRFVAADRGLFRTASIHKSAVNFGWGAALGLQLVTGDEPLTLGHYQRYFDLLEEGEARPAAYRGNWNVLDRLWRVDLLDELGVRYLIAPAAARVSGPRFRLVQVIRDEPVFVFYRGMARGNLAVWRNGGELPRAHFAERVEFVPDEDAAAARLQQLDVRGATVVMSAERAAQTPEPEDTVQIESWAPGGLEISARSARERFLLVSEVWHPGWRAHLDGAAAPLLRADLALMGLWLPGGAHRISLRFAPLFWSPSLAVSAISALALLALALRRTQ